MTYVYVCVCVCVCVRERESMGFSDNVGVVDRVWSLGVMMCVLR